MRSVGISLSLLAGLASVPIHAESARCSVDALCLEVDLSAGAVYHIAADGSETWLGETVWFEPASTRGYVLDVSFVGPGGEVEIVGADGVTEQVAVADRSRRLAVWTGVLSDAAGDPLLIFSGGGAELPSLPTVTVKTKPSTPISP